MTVPRRSNGASNREKMLQEEEHLKHRKAAMRKKLKQQGEFHPGQITPGAAAGGGEGDSERTDVITQKPLNFHHEEKTRRKETDKWLDRHFGGSEWSLSQRSSNPSDPQAVAHNRSRFYRYHQATEPSANAGEDFNAKVRRAQSFNCIPVSYNNPVSRVVKHTTTTYRPGMEGKVVYSSITKNVVSPPDPKMRAYHSASNLNSRNTPIPGDNRQLNSNYETHFKSVPGNIDHQPTMKSHSTSLLNGIVKEHSPILGKKDTSVVREIPITKLNQSYGNILESDLSQKQPHRPPRRGKSSGDKFMKSTGDLYALNSHTDQNYYENRRSYYFGASTDNLDAPENVQSPAYHDRTTFESQTLAPTGKDKRKSRKDQLISESTPLKSYERVQSAPDPGRQMGSNMFAAATNQGGESITTTGFESTAGMLGVTYQNNNGRYHETPQKEQSRVQGDVDTSQQRQIPIREEVYHDSPTPDRKAKRLVPTVERGSSSRKEHDRVVYRSESTRKATR